MKAAVKKMMEASAVAQSIIYSAAKTTGKLSEAQKHLIANAWAEAAQGVSNFKTTWAAKDFIMTEYLNNTNLINGSNSMAEAFDPYSVLEAHAGDITSDEFDRLQEYASQIIVKYWK